MYLNLPEPKGILDGISFDHQSTSYSKLLYSVLHLMGFLLLYLQMKQRMSTNFNHESHLTFFTLLLCYQKVFPLFRIGVNVFHPTLKKKVFAHCFSLLVYVLMDITIQQINLYPLQGLINQKIDIFSFVALPSLNTKKKHPKYKQDLGKDFSSQAFIER